MEWEEAKERYQAEYPEIHEFSISKYKFLFRPLNIRELSYSTNPENDATEVEDYYVQAATLYPEDFDFDSIKAGFVTQYADAIIKASGFDNLGTVNSILEKYRNKAKTDIIHKMKSYILTALPAYKEAEIEDLSMDEFGRMLVLSEEIITVQQAISGLESTGFKLVITPVGEDATEEVELEPTKKKVPKKPVSQEEHEQQRAMLIAKVRQLNQSSMSAENRRELDERGLENMDPESLRRILGITKEHDPIADKLAAAQDQVARVARSMGLPYE